MLLAVSTAARTRLRLLQSCRCIAPRTRHVARLASLDTTRVRAAQALKKLPFPTPRLSQLLMEEQKSAGLWDAEHTDLFIFSLFYANCADNARRGRQGRCGTAHVRIAVRPDGLGALCARSDTTRNAFYHAVYAMLSNITRPMQVRRHSVCTSACDER
jgi:hypothetical protein